MESSGARYYQSSRWENVLGELHIMTGGIYIPCVPLPIIAELIPQLV
jgi:tellurite resistance protein TehA-like permease